MLHLCWLIGEIDPANLGENDSVLAFFEALEALAFRGLSAAPLAWQVSLRGSKRL